MKTIGIDNFNILSEYKLIDNQYMNQAEYRVLFDIIKNNNIKNILEIGVASGKTSYNILKNFSKIERYIGVDVDDSYSFGNIPNQVNERSNCPGQIALESKDSRFDIFLFHKGIEDIDLNKFENFFDLIIINGDHSYNGVKKDTLFSMRLLNKSKDSFIFWHDYNNGLKDVDDFIDDYNCRDSVTHVDGCRCCYEKFFGKNIKIIQPCKIGDILICLPIAYHYYLEGYSVVWPICENYYFLQDYIYYVTFIPTNNDICVAVKESYNIYKSFRTIDLCFGFTKSLNDSEWAKSTLQFDEIKYFLS